MEAVDKIREATNTARDELVSERSPKEIDGVCHKNVIYLCDYLRLNTDFVPYIRWGAVHNYGYEYESVKEAEQKSMVHFWVELQPEDAWIHTDIFSMESVKDGLCRGDVFTSYGLPESYQKLDDSLFEYDPTVIDSEMLVSYFEYEYLKDIIEPVN